MSSESKDHTKNPLIVLVGGVGGINYIVRHSQLELATQYRHGEDVRWKAMPSAIAQAADVANLASRYR